MALYQSYNKKWWKGRLDGNTPGHLRWHQIVKGLDFGRSGLDGIAILGFSCDEGVRRNLGRTGAAAGPEAVQRAMCNLPVHAAIPLYDAGNVLCDNEDLESAQKLLGQKVWEIHKTGCMACVIGGGHEMAWGHFQGLARAWPDANIGIINVDAHFDLRSADQPNSGTPFLQIAEFQADRNGAFNYMVLGVQKHANTKALFDTADKLKVQYYYDTEFQQFQIPVLEQAIHEFGDKVDLIYLSIDMDCFNVAIAPGVSAINVSGIAPGRTALTVLRTLVRTGKICSFDIAEVNPAYDIDGRTSKLAAFIIFEMVGELDKLRLRDAAKAEKKASGRPAK